jgi:hypothetical protein
VKVIIVLRFIYIIILMRVELIERCSILLITVNKVPCVQPVINSKHFAFYRNRQKVWALHKSTRLA